MRQVLRYLNGCETVVAGARFRWIRSERFLTRTAAITTLQDIERWPFAFANPRQQPGRVRISICKTCGRDTQSTVAVRPRPKQPWASQCQ